MLKKPMTMKELFTRLRVSCKKRTNCRIFWIIDWGVYRSVLIKIYEFDLKSNPAYGGSKGIYLDLWIEYFEDDKKCTSSIGTFKTLQENNKTMHVMAALLANFILEERAYVNANLSFRLPVKKGVKYFFEKTEKSAPDYPFGEWT